MAVDLAFGSKGFPGCAAIGVGATAATAACAALSLAGAGAGGVEGAATGFGVGLPTWSCLALSNSGATCVCDTPLGSTGMASSGCATTGAGLAGAVGTALPFCLRVAWRASQSACVVSPAAMQSLARAAAGGGVIISHRTHLGGLEIAIDFGGEQTTTFGFVGLASVRHRNRTDRNTTTRQRQKKQEEVTKILEAIRASADVKVNLP